MNDDDLYREFRKVDEVLAACELHLAHHAAANAALHASETVMYSPLHARVVAARRDISGAMKRITSAWMYDVDGDPEQRQMVEEIGRKIIGSPLGGEK